MEEHLLNGEGIALVAIVVVVAVVIVFAILRSKGPFSFKLGGGGVHGTFKGGGLADGSVSATDIDAGRDVDVAGSTVAAQRIHGGQDVRLTGHASGDESTSSSVESPDDDIDPQPPSEEA